MKYELNHSTFFYVWSHIYVYVTLFLKLVHSRLSGGNPFSLLLLWSISLYEFDVSVLT